MNPVFYGERLYEKTKGKSKIGLIILVIILSIVAIAIFSTVYVYISGMLDERSTTPDMLCTIGNNGELSVSYVEFDAYWSDIKIKTNNEAVSLNGYPVGTTWTDAVNLNLIGMVHPGDSISIGGTSDIVEISMMYLPTETLIGTWIKNENQNNEDTVTNAQIIADMVFQKINNERNRNHLQPFIKNTNLVMLAYKQSNYMAIHNGIFLAEEIEDFDVDAIMDYQISMNYVGQLLAYVPLGYIELNDDAVYIEQDSCEDIASYVFSLWMDGEYKEQLLSNEKGYDINAGVGVSYHTSMDTQDAYYVSLLMLYEEN